MSYWKEHWVWYTVAMVVLVGMVVTGIFTGGGEEEGTGSSSRIEVEEVYFVMTDQTQLYTNMDILVFITNDGKTDLSDVTVRAFAVETDSNLARDEAVKVMGELKGQTTIEGKLTIKLPNNDTYRVELLVFKDGKLTIRGSGTVNLKGVGQASAYKTDQGDDMMMTPSESDDDGSGFADGSSGSAICMILLAVFIIIVIVIVVTIVLKKKN